MQSSIIPLFNGSNLNMYKVVGFLKIANQNWDIEDPISNAIFNNSSNNPHVYRVVGLLRLHREIGTQMEILFKVLQKKLINKSKKILSQFWYYELKALSRPTYC